ncbi:head-tail connector protein [Clostridium formicaceticum]|uniref:DNA packaging protein n=1 Tax=Clostridium formicaceticum TaxID=1497 RepID=A0AAC9RL95_9CLOT|nr:head-tail connector protein [Clostridium formicaceticum]AOY76914.1 DNA packaging protein [Clostridium formicaceticum]ARE87393.1 Phage gp6-like head-tail connector protein [Clostridium formicaceticum]
MILTLEEVKQFLKLDDFDDEDAFIYTLISVAEQYLKNATGKDFDKKNEMAKLFCKVLISDWYENRTYIHEGKITERVRFTVQTILTQLQYCEGDE